jgi:fructose-1-phosphate kinase PfkB-like protein
VLFRSSLPPGVSADIYGAITLEGKSRGSKVIVDCQGPQLAAGVEAGPYLIKPNLLELRELAGLEYNTLDALQISKDEALKNIKDSLYEAIKTLG